MTWRIVRSFAPLLLSVASLGAQELLTLERALQEARSANARLPIPALDVAIAREEASAARAQMWLRVAVEGDFLYAPPGGYDPALTDAGELRLQIAGRQPIYDGGARRAAVAHANAQVDAASARYRIAEKDLELEVRTRFSEMLEAESEIQTRREGIDRLNSYQTSLKSRQAAGQGVAADVLKTRVRLASEEANLVEAERRLEQARFALNDLMGRDPAAPLEPAPAPPSNAPGLSWIHLPEIVEAEAEAHSLEAQVVAARAEGKPHLFLSADAGFLGSETSHLSGDRIRRDAGYSVGLTFSWPVWDLGAIRARVTENELRLKQAKQNVTVLRRQSRLQWEQVEATLRNLQQEMEVLSRSVPDARDSYLEAESRYRGGAATALEVLDAYSASVEVSVRLAETIARYRIAQALALRWGEP